MTDSHPVELKSGSTTPKKKSSKSLGDTFISPGLTPHTYSAHSPKGA